MKVNSQKSLNTSTQNSYRRLIKSVWLFPAILTVLLVLMTSLKINGSSMGVYHTLFYGKTNNDPALLVNLPQGIRSDEWLVNTQMTLAQKNNNFEQINNNIGNGEDVSLIMDVPYKDWSTLFKPHNLVFFILPFDNAFAFRWWFIAYLLIVACYFFILVLLPGKRLLAALLATGLFLSPFIQWWYLNGTLGSISYGLFGGVILTKLLGRKYLRQGLLWGLLLAYVLVCFALILYPPFQIPVALGMLVFAVGYCFEKLGREPRRIVWQKLGIITTAIVVAGVITAIFLGTRAEVVKTIQNTAYPANRIQKSGGFDFDHLLSSQLGAQLQFASRAGHYSINGPTNQSESSNFILLLPFLLLPSAYLIRQYHKNLGKIDWPLVLVNSAFLLALLWLFVPNLGILGMITQLERVPHARLLIGLGLLGILQIVLFIRRYSGFKNILIKRSSAIIYSVAIFTVEIGLGLYEMYNLPGFIGIYRVVAFALPIPIIIYLLLRKHFEWAAAVLLLFAFIMTYRVNPLYRGTDIISKTPISQAIKDISAKDDSRWVTEHFLLENFVFMNGARSLSGVYAYPQLELWQNVDPTAREDVYNRYAHTIFAFDRDPSKEVPTKIVLTGSDTFTIITEPCGDFIKSKNVRYLLTGAALSSQESCLSLVKQVNYPAVNFYIYKTNPY